MNPTKTIAIVAATIAWNPLALAGEAEQDLSRQLTNPVATLISVDLYPAVREHL